MQGSHPPAAARHESQPAPADTTFDCAERHARRVMVAGGLVTTNLVALELARHMTHAPAVTSALAIGLAAAMFLLLHRLGATTLRFTVRGARRQTRASLERSCLRTVEALAAALEAKDAYTLDHARSITETAVTVGRRLGLRGQEVRDLRLGALLHDIGKIGVPGAILNKPGTLDADELELMKQHTIIGEQIIAPIEFLDGVRPLVLHEHERWDGAGYPHGLRGEQIPLGARIIFVCDAFHAMTSDRPYRRALPSQLALDEVARNVGTQFHPEAARAFLEEMGWDVDAEIARVAAEDSASARRPAGRLLVEPGDDVRQVA